MEKDGGDLWTRHLVCGPTEGALSILGHPYKYYICIYIYMYMYTVQKNNTLLIHGTINAVLYWLLYLK